MPARDNAAHQLNTLTETYRFLLAEGSIARGDLITKLIAAQSGMEAGVDINAVSFEGSQTTGTVMYPKEIVAAACIAILNQTSGAGGTDPYNGADESVVQADLSKCRIET